MKTSTKIKISLIGTFLAVSSTLFAQVKIGDNPTTINAGSVLELESTNKGLLMPRVALTNTTTWGLGGTATAGMHVYNSSSSIASSNAAYPTLAAKIGEYYWDGTGWVALANAKGCSSFDAKSTTPQSVPVYPGAPSPPIVLKPDSVAYDPTNSYNPSTGEYTVPATGFYSFSIFAGDDYQGPPAPPATSLRNSTLILNSANRGVLAFSVFPKLYYGDGSWNSVSFTNYLIAGDKITVRVAVVHSAGTQPTTTTNVSFIKFSGSRIDCTNN